MRHSHYRSHQGEDTDGVSTGTGLVDFRHVGLGLQPNSPKR